MDLRTMSALILPSLPCGWSRRLRCPGKGMNPVFWQKLFNLAWRRTPAPTTFDDSDPHLRHKDNTKIRAAVMQTDELVKRGQDVAATLTLLLIKPDQLNKKQICDHVYWFPCKPAAENLFPSTAVSG
jgi:hypothetical protein